MKKVAVTEDIIFSQNNPLVLIAGPCVIESEESALELVFDIKKICRESDIKFIFKASFDKANRTSIKSFRGPGLKQGLKILNRIREDTGVPVITDIHSPEQAPPVAEIVDLIQIPAFLCRQTDLLISAAETSKPVLVKKGQFMAPWDMKQVVEKIESVGNNNTLLCERGTFFGYNNLVVDMRSLIEMKKNGCPVIFDGTHSIQEPGAKGVSSGGKREYVRYLTRAAVAVGIEGVFLEVHHNPERALSDGANMINISALKDLLNEINAIHKLINYK